MNHYVKAIESRMTEDQKDMLRRIYEPREVAIPIGGYARRDLCVLADGEIRSYGRLNEYGKTCKKGERAAYIASIDGGLSWTRHYAHGKMNSCTYFEKPDIYIGVIDVQSSCTDVGEGLYVMRSKLGPDDPSPAYIKLSDDPYCDTFLPCQSHFGDRIWFTTQCISAEAVASGDLTATFFYSDDWGETWEKRELPPVKAFETVYPHKGSRWCKTSGTEPYTVELAENKLMMLIRTPLDCFYKSYSYDGGDTWTTPEPSEFYGTNTTPFLLRLSDGRVLTFWNNTRPYPELNHSAKMPHAREEVFTGHGGAAFTNRDAAHVAISNDGGETFIGYRELFLNPVRNNVDFRYVGGSDSCLDKSVHQFQAFELPFGKILVCLGQNVACSRLLIFDVDWLYEKGRYEDFVMGTANITNHTYLISICSNYIGEAGNGHCQWNRMPCAVPMPDPDGGYREMLYVSKRHDDRLLSDISGVGWNFPVSKVGSVTIELKLMEKEARFVLSDRWNNVCDPFAAVQSPFYFDLDTDDVGTGFVKVVIDYDTEKETASVSVNEKHLFKLRMTAPCPVGISYLILQCATDGDSKGFYVRSLEKQ